MRRTDATVASIRRRMPRNWVRLRDRLRAARRAQFNGRQIHLQRGQLLAQVVVQFTGNTGFFLFAHVLQIRRQFAQFLARRL